MTNDDTAKAATDEQVRELEETCDLCMSDVGRSIGMNTGVRFTADDVHPLLLRLRRAEAYEKAVRDAAIVDWIDDTLSPRDIVNKLICYNNQIALDPLVSEDARKLRDTYLEPLRRAEGVVEKACEFLTAEGFVGFATRSEKVAATQRVDTARAELQVAIAVLAAARGGK